MKKTSERVSPNQQPTVEDQLIFQMHLKTYAYAASFAKDKTILDIGSGDGYGTDYLKSYAQKIVGVDISQESVEEARKKYQAPNLEFKQLRDDTFPFEDSSFDLVISFQVIEHVKNTKLFLDEIHRVLKAGGQMILSTPNAKIRLLFFQNPWNKYHIQEFTTGGLSKILEEKFQNIHFLGLSLEEPYLTMEKKRTNRNKWILWPFSLKLWPYPFRRFLLTCLWSVQSLLKGSRQKTEENIEDVALILKIDIASAPSIIAHAEKS